MTPISDEDPLACIPAATSGPLPVPRPVRIEQHGELRNDPYGWLRDPAWQEVLDDPSRLDPAIRAHLEAENDHYEAATQGLAELRERLFAEFRGRMKEDESSVPEADGPFAYAVRYRRGGDYPVFVRTPRAGGEETILFDGDREAGGDPFFSIEAVEHSPDHRLIAYAVDRIGAESCDIRIRTVETGEEFAETITATDGDLVWTADATAFFYVERDRQQRPRRVKRHRLGTDPADDELVYEEADESYVVSVDASQSGAYVFIGASKGTSSEYRFLPSDAPPGTKPRLIAPRREDELYFPEHRGEHFYLLTDAQGALDFKIVTAPVDAPDREHWVDWLPHRAGVTIEEFATFADWLVRLEREDARQRIVFSRYDGSGAYEIAFDEAAFALGLEPGIEFETDTLRFAYESPATPEQIVDFDLATRTRTIRKEEVIPSGHDPARYLVERLALPAADGAEVPVTVLRLAATPLDGTAPILLYGYGSYGLSLDAGFHPDVLSLVDRGMVYAMAHVRGGADKGRAWYHAGRLDGKHRSFSDFVAVAEGLQRRGYGRPAGTVIAGASAGGLLVGAALNLRPELFAGAIAAVPFVDILNTMSDATLPLTPVERVEWGDPIADPAAFRAIAAYAPYENIRADVPYPPVLATGGLTDYRVTYWEPAKWIARLRANARGGPFLLRMQLDTGHGGAAARFEALRERAHEYAFALAVVGLADAEPIRHRSAP